MTPARRVPAKKTPAKKAPVRKAAPEKPVAKKAPAKRAPAAATPVRASRVEDLRADYDRLGVLLASERDGSKAAALARERRMIGELLESLEAPTEVSVVDQLAARRRSRPGAAGSAAGRRKSG